MSIRLKDSQALQLWLSHVATKLVLRLALLPKGEEAGHVWLSRLAPDGVG